MPLSMIRAAEGRFRGEPAVVLQNGDLRAVFVPGIGMTGVSLRLRNKEYLALPGGLDALRTGHTGGLPLLAPWANRLASMRYKVGSHGVDLTHLGVHTDATQAWVACTTVGQLFPQLPQFAASVVTSVSQPSAAWLLQLRKPVSHAPV